MHTTSNSTKQQPQNSGILITSSIGECQTIYTNMGVSTICLIHLKEFPLNTLHTNQFIQETLQIQTIQVFKRRRPDNSDLTDNRSVQKKKTDNSCLPDSTSVQTDSTSVHKKKTRQQWSGIQPDSGT